jgi:hypothetical protein
LLKKLNKTIETVFCKLKLRKNSFSVASGGPQPASALCGRQTLPLALPAC